jgi:ComF family protein
MKNGEPPTRELFPAVTKVFHASSPLSAFYDACLNLIYPQPCRVCDERIVESRADGVACRACWKKTRVFGGGGAAEILCEKCGAYLETNAAQKFNAFCRRCDEDAFDAARAAGLYEHALLATILNLKEIPRVPKRLQEVFFRAFLKSPFTDATKIIPVPLSKARFKERGFNQAARLAKTLAKRTGLPLDEHTLIRQIHTPPHRAAMDKKSRAESVRGAFQVARPKLIENEIILLVDDVFTSGATASNCAAALKEKGARSVYVLTAARAF